MNESNHPKRGIHRRDLIKDVVAAGFGLGVFVFSPSISLAESNVSKKEKQNLIQIENAKPGTRDWMLTKTSVGTGQDWYRSRTIEGYCSETSVRAGDTLKVMVSANPVSEFDLEIFRTGYYGGAGARTMKTFTSVQGKTQPDAEIGENRLRECKWEPTVEFEIPKDWVSGVYLGKLTAKEDGSQSYIIFTVRDDRPCDLLFQSSVLTWQSYNSWPNQEWSIYHDNSNKYRPKDEGLLKARGKKMGGNMGPASGWVSYDRPYAQFRYDHFLDRPDTVGSGEFLLWEFPLSYWLEQQGYDVSYITNVDTHRDGQGLLRAKGFVSAGHDAFWTRDIYSNISAARDAGVNIAFMGSGATALVGFLSPAEGQPRPVLCREGFFVGEQYGRKYAELSGFTDPPGRDIAVMVGGSQGGEHAGAGDWVCAKPDHWVYEDTHMKEGDAIPGVIGWHYHGDPVPKLPGIEVLATSIPQKNNKPAHAATLYNGPKGSIVFSAGSTWWAQALSSPPGHVLPVNSHVPKANKIKGPDPRAQRITANVLDRFIK